MQELVIFVFELKFWDLSQLPLRAKTFFFNAILDRRGRVSFLLHHSTYQARYGEQVCAN